MENLSEYEIIQASKNALPEELEVLASLAVIELEGLETAEDLRVWWIKYYLQLGHRRLGRMLIGKKQKPFTYRGNESNTKGDIEQPKSKTTGKRQGTKNDWAVPKRMRPAK